MSPDDASLMDEFQSNWDTSTTTGLFLQTFNEAVAIILLEELMAGNVANIIAEVVSAGAAVAMGMMAVGILHPEWLAAMVAEVEREKGQPLANEDSAALLISQIPIGRREVPEKEEAFT
jgi:hypothetical protein